MMYLAGIQRITNVFYFPESKDIVIAGPAEGWFPGHEGAMVGVRTLRPVCELQDLVAALRAYAPSKEGAEVVGCSIDPTQEGIARLQAFLEQFGPGGPRQFPAFVQGIRNSVGAQMIRVDGVPATTHAARIMVAADYRMKLIALGGEKPPVPVNTFIANTVPVAKDALLRWFFEPDYASVILTEDRTGMELVGDGVKLVAGQDDPGSAAFTKSFTQQYPRIAEKALVFAQLRNWIDMLICAAHIQREDFYGKSGWSMAFFGSEEKYPLETFTAPKEVEPLVGEKTMRSGRNTVFLAPVGGGVVIEAESALDDENVKPDTNKKIANQQAKIGLNLPENVWWWDVR
jgi:hypothetical protein